MNEALKMQISAFVDGELPDNEAELLLRRLGQDVVMREQVAQYLEIGRLLRHEESLPGMHKLRGRIAAAIGDERMPEVTAPEVVGSRFMTPASSMAIAATVAVVALVGLSQFTSQVDSGFQDAVAIDNAPSYTEPSPQQVLLNSPSERELDYFRRHSDSSPDSASSDFFFRMATFELHDGIEVIEPQGRLANDDATYHILQPGDDDERPDDAARTP